MFKIAQKWWKSLKLKNQILILQSLLITVVFIILVTISLQIIDKLSIFLEQEFIQKFLLKSIISMLSIIVGETSQFGKNEYYKLMAEKGIKQNLYDFQIENNIVMTSILDNCLESPHTKQFYSYEFCFGIYGNKTDDSVLKNIKTYIQLQNLFTPLHTDELFLAEYNVYLDQQMFFSQYQGEHLKVLNSDIQEAINILINYQLALYAKSIQSQTGSNLLIFQTFPGSNIANGILYQAGQQFYKKLIQKEEFYNQRLLYLSLAGEIISDSQDEYPQGSLFYNSSLTGFNISQFEKIIQFTQGNSSVPNECQKLFQDQILCLIDINFQEKLIFSKFIVSQGIPSYIIVIVDAKSISQIKEQFQDYLTHFFEQQIQLISWLFIVGLLLCLLLQYVLIKRLNKPLIKLENIAKYHMNMNQYRLERIIRLTKVQSQIQKLSDAFFDLIDLNQGQKERQLQINNINNIQEAIQQGEILKQHYKMHWVTFMRSRFNYLGKDQYQINFKN